jgi:hypothetical protein
MASVNQIQGAVDIGTEATKLAHQLGMPVFPAKPDGGIYSTKELSDKEGRGSFYVATKELEEINELWSRFPESTVIGARMGRESGLICLDIDVKNGNGFDALKAAGIKLPADSETWCEETPSGGRHYYFKWDPDRVLPRNKQGILDGVDIRGEGGLAFIAPSIKSGKTYKWITGPFAGAEAAPVPEWIYKIFEDEAAEKEANKVEYSSEELAEVINLPSNAKLERAKAYMSKVPPVEMGSRNSAAYNMACKLGNDFDLEPVEVTNLMIEWNNRFDRALPILEMHRAIESALKAKAEGKLENPAGSALVSRKGTEMPELGLTALKGLLVPKGWEIEPDGAIFRTKYNAQEESQGRELVSDKGIFVTGVCEQIDSSSGDVSVKIAWPKFRGGWKSSIIGMRKVKDSGRLLELADKGAPVDEFNKKKLVKFLGAFIKENEDKLPVLGTTNQMGWQGRKGELGFLCGNTLITPSGEFKSTKLSDLDESGWENDMVAFQPPISDSETGIHQAVGAFKRKGSIEDWLETMKEVDPFPRVKVGLFAALVPPLLKTVLRPEDVKNFTVDFSSQTSKGKTTTLQIAASLYGNAEQAAEDSVLRNWSGSHTAREILYSALSDLPFICDETKQATQNKVGVTQLQQTLYSIGQGMAKSRGTVTGGLRSSMAFKTVMLSSGEQPITSIGMHQGGVFARVVSISGVPFEAFGDEKVDAGASVNAIKRNLKKSYGHIGPMFIRHIIANPGMWESWREDFNGARNLLVDLAKDDTVLSRLADAGAAIHAASIIFNHMLESEALENPFMRQLSILSLWKDIIAESTDATGARKAFKRAISYAQLNPHRFYDAASLEQDTPNNGWLGRYDQSTENWPYIGYAPEDLTKILSADGYPSPEAIYREWLANEWVIEQKGYRYQARVGKGKNSARGYLICLKREAIEKVTHVGPKEGELKDPQAERYRTEARKLGEGDWSGIDSFKRDGLGKRTSKDDDFRHDANRKHDDDVPF